MSARGISGRDGETDKERQRKTGRENEGKIERSNKTKMNRYRERKRDSRRTREIDTDTQQIDTDTQQIYTDTQRYTTDIRRYTQIHNRYTQIGLAETDTESEAQRGGGRAELERQEKRCVLQMKKTVDVRLINVLRMLIKVAAAETIGSVYPKSGKTT